jgi:hypothetical protein
MTQWDPDCKGDPCSCPGEPPEGVEVVAEEPGITLGDIHKALTTLTALGASKASIQWVLTNQMPPDPMPGCPDHEPVQHRDMKRPWCNKCGRDALGALIGKPRRFPLGA